MSKPSTFSAISVLLLIVGLAIGVGAGYFLASSTVQSQLKEYENQVDSLSEEVTNLADTVVDLQDKASEYEDQVSAMETEVLSLSTYTTNLETQVVNLESNVTGLESDLEEAQIKIDGYKLQIEELTTVSSDYVRYTTYGLTFEVPFNISVTVEGENSSPPDEEYGFISGQTIGSEEELNITWMGNLQSSDLEESLDEMFDQLMGYTIVKGQLKNSTLRGHTIVYQEFSLIDGGETTYGVYGVWNCDVNNRLYQIGYLVEDQDKVSNFLVYLSFFICH